jgi:hypothetical protein
MKYTFTFDRLEEAKFRQVLSRLDESEYNIIEDVRPVDHKPDADIRYVDRQMIIEMDPEAALTFRLGMKHVKIRRERTEEELAEEKALHDANTVTITIQVPRDQMPTP